MSLREIGDRVDFIRANTRLQAPPHVPEISLHLADEAMDLWKLTEEELDTLGLPLPFWAFAWAGGQALARYVLDRPETVVGRSVLAFAAGAGLEAIAAAKAGAARVLATEIDPFALVALELNAGMNAVSLEIAGIERRRRGAPLAGAAPAAAAPARAAAPAPSAWEKPASVGVTG